MLRSASAALALALTASLASCGGSKEVKELNRFEELPVELSVTLKGDINFSHREKVNARFVVRRFKDKEPDAQASQVVGTENLEPMKGRSGAIVAGFAVIPFEGDGDYTIPVGSPQDLLAQAQAGLQPRPGSSIKVEWWETGNPDDTPELFMRRAKPCKVDVEHDGTEGTLTCPDVTNEAQNKHFSLSLRWTAPLSSAPSTTTT